MSIYQWIIHKLNIKPFGLLSARICWHLHIDKIHKKIHSYSKFYKKVEKVTDTSKERAS